MPETSPSAPSVLIAEIHPKHWNTAEPLVEQFLAQGFRVTLLGPPAFGELFGSRRFSQRGLVFLAYTSRRELSSLLAPGRFGLVLLSPAFLEERAKHLAAMPKAKALAVQGFNLHLARRAAGHPGLVLHLHRIAWAGAGPDPELGGVLNRMRLTVRQRLLAGAKAMLVYDEPIAGELRRRLSGLGYDTPVLAAPLAVFRGGEPPAKGPEGRLSVVIPGRIDLQARSYVWAGSIPEADRTGLNLWLVGKANLPEDLGVLRELKELGFNQPRGVDGGFVPFDLYDSLLARADVLLAPLKARENLLPGRDTITGAVVEAARVGKPLLLPDWYRLGPDLEGCVLAYSGEEHLARLLLELKDDPARLHRLKQKAHENSLAFRAERLKLVDQLRPLAGPS